MYVYVYIYICMHILRIEKLMFKRFEDLDLDKRYIDMINADVIL